MKVLIAILMWQLGNKYAFSSFNPVNKIILNVYICLQEESGFSQTFNMHLNHQGDLVKMQT